MARVKDIEINEVSKELRPIYKKFIENYGPFSNQAKVFAHRPIIFKYMMSMLMEMADKPIIDKRYLEIAIVSVSAINKCDYCVAHHAPNLISEGLSNVTVDNILGSFFSNSNWPKRTERTWEDSSGRVTIFWSHFSR